LIDICALFRNRELRNSYHSAPWKELGVDAPGMTLADTEGLGEWGLSATVEAAVRRPPFLARRS
jgi:hypothetical protein